MANRQLFGVLSKQVRSVSSTPTLQAAAAPAAKAVKVPLQMHGLEGRYAHAIYSAAAKNNQLDAVDKDFQGILNILKSQTKVNDVLKNPLLTKEQRTNAVNELAVKKGANQLTVNTLTLLADNGRLGRLQSVAKSFCELMRAHNGEVTAAVTTAKSLSAAELKELTTVLTAFLKKGNKLQLETKVDPNVIGGMVVVLGDRYIDLSISSKLNTFEKCVKETL